MPKKKIFDSEEAKKSIVLANKYRAKSLALSSKPELEKIDVRLEDIYKMVDERTDQIENGELAAKAQSEALMVLSNLWEEAAELQEKRERIENGDYSVL